MPSKAGTIVREFHAGSDSQGSWIPLFITALSDWHVFHLLAYSSDRVLSHQIASNKMLEFSVREAYKLLGTADRVVDEELREDCKVTWSILRHLCKSNCSGGYCSIRYLHTNVYRLRMDPNMIRCVCAV